MSSVSPWIKACHIDFVANWCAGLRYLLRRLAPSRNRCSHTWFRIFSATSVPLFAATVVSVVVKPF